MAGFVLYGGAGFLVALVLGYVLGRRPLAVVIACLALLALLAVQLGLVWLDDDPPEGADEIIPIFVITNAVGCVVGAFLGWRGRVSAERGMTDV